MSDRAEFAAFAVAVGQNVPGLNPEYVGDWCAKMRRLATTHARYCLTACNTGLTEAEQKRQERLEAKIAAMCADEFAGFAPHFQHDPRGATVKLALPDGRSNSFAGACWCIPTGRI
jgi:hypothetical protein